MELINGDWVVDCLKKPTDPPVQYTSYCLYKLRNGNKQNRSRWIQLEFKPPLLSMRTARGSPTCQSSMAMQRTQEDVLDVYNVKGKPKLNFFALNELKQGPMEKIGDFWFKILVQCNCINDSVNAADVETLEQHDFSVADRNNFVKECFRAATTIQDFHTKMIFIAGLYGEVQAKVMETTPRTAMDTLKAVLEAGMLIADAKGQLKLPTKTCAITKQISFNEDKVRDE